MKFIKGVMIGGLITTGLVMMYAESGKMNKKTVMKQGKKMAKKIGIIKRRRYFRQSTSNTQK